MVPDSRRMKILFVAADRMEFPGILGHATAVRRVDLPVDWARAGALNGNETLLVANGVGHSRAAAASKAAIAAFRPDAVVSTGYCGALSPKLKIADIVVATQVAAADAIYNARRPQGPTPDPLSLTFSSGSVHSISYVAQTAEQKRELAAHGSIAVEMEAAGVAAEATLRSLPFYCVRVVTDLAGETMANDFNKALRPDGHFATMSILRVALLDPANRLPELIRLRKRCMLASRALGEFFASNRF
jgi:adenosylhomocysteine nucleosidase